MLHFLILAAALAASTCCALPASGRRERFLQEFAAAPAPGPDSASAERWDHHGSRWDYHGPGGSDAWYLPEEVHLLEKTVDGIVENDRSTSADIVELKDEFNKQNKTLTELSQEFEELKVRFL